jgi:hypothetical protein
VKKLAPTLPNAGFQCQGGLGLSLCCSGLDALNCKIEVTVDSHLPGACRWTYVYFGWQDLSRAGDNHWVGWSLGSELCDLSGLEWGQLLFCPPHPPPLYQSCFDSILIEIKAFFFFFKGVWVFLSVCAPSVCLVGEESIEFSGCGIPCGFGEPNSGPLQE